MLFKYFMLIKNNIEITLLYKSRLYFRGCMYFIVILLFNEILSNVTKEQRSLWYVTATQLIVFSASPTIAFQISYEIQRNQMISFLIKPIDYIYSKLTEAASETLIKLLLFFLIGFSTTLFLVKTNPIESVQQILYFIYLIISGLLISCFINICIGLLSFWLHDVKSIIYLNLTSSFCFGGLIIPISSYPKNYKCFVFLPHILGFYTPQHTN